MYLCFLQALVCVYNLHLCCVLLLICLGKKMFHFVSTIYLHLVSKNFLIFVLKNSVSAFLNNRVFLYDAEYVYCVSDFWEIRQCIPQVEKSDNVSHKLRNLTMYPTSPLPLLSLRKLPLDCGLWPRDPTSPQLKCPGLRSLKAVKVYLLVNSHVFLRFSLYSLQYPRSPKLKCPALSTPRILDMVKLSKILQTQI